MFTRQKHLDGVADETRAQISLRIIVSDGSKYTVANNVGGSKIGNFVGRGGSVRERLEPSQTHSQAHSEDGPASQRRDSHPSEEDGWVEGAIPRISMAEVEATQPGGLTAIETCPVLLLYGCVRGDGGTYVVPSPPARVDAETTGSQRSWLCRSGGLCMGFGACDTANGIVSVGTAAGSVDVYGVALVKADVTLVSVAPMHALSLEPCGYTPKQLRPVVALQWDSQGKALACLFGGGGIVLWSLSGCRTACSLLSTESLESASGPVGVGSKDPRSICWTREGYRVVYGLASGLLPEYPASSLCERVG